MLVVNKLAKTYAREPVQRLLEFYPYFIGDVQSLLLGRIIILGAGELDLHNASMVKIESKAKVPVGRSYLRSLKGWRLFPIAIR